MKIPKNLREKSKSTSIHLVRGMQEAIKAECCRCMDIRDGRRVKDCAGLHLEDGNCPLYEFRPWG